MRTLNIVILLICFIVTACQTAPTATLVLTPEPQDGTSEPVEPEETEIPTEVPQASPTPTEAPGRAIMVASDQASGFYTTLYDNWQAETASSGLIWARQPGLVASDLNALTRLVVITPGTLSAETVMSLAAAAPQTDFVIFDLPGINLGANIFLVGPQRPDQQGFIAGYIAAMITDDWRVGVLSQTDTPEGQAAQAGFLNGAVFFCGLCNPVFGPIIDYPVAAGPSAAASSAEWVAAAQELIDQAVTTVFLGPGATDSEMLALLAAKGVRLIGSQPMPEGLSEIWVTSVLPDDRPVRDLLTEILTGAEGKQVDFRFVLTQINQSLVGPGKQAHVEALIADVLAGTVGTGVEYAP